MKVYRPSVEWRIQHRLASTPRRFLDSELLLSQTYHSDHMYHLQTFASQLYCAEQTLRKICVDSAAKNNCTIGFQNRQVFAFLLMQILPRCREGDGEEMISKCSLMSNRNKRKCFLKYSITIAVSSHM